MSIRTVATASFWDTDDDFDLWAVTIENSDGDVMGDRMSFATIGAAIDWANKWAIDRGLVLATGGLEFKINRPGQENPDA